MDAEAAEEKQEIPTSATKTNYALDGERRFSHFLAAAIAADASTGADSALFAPADDDAAFRAWSGQDDGAKEASRARLDEEAGRLASYHKCHSSSCC